MSSEISSYRFEWVWSEVKIQGIAERHVLVSAVVFFHLSNKAHSCEEPNH